MQIAFKTKNDKQLQAAQYWVDPNIEEILYGGAKGGGKSFLGASLIFGDALIYPETHYFIARKELIDLRKFTIPTVHEVIQNFGLDFDKYARYNGQDNVFELYNKSKVYLISCREEPSDPLFERFGSMQMTRGWIEEGGEVPENAKSNLWLSIGRWKNEEYNLKKKMLVTANPKKGWMKRDFVDPYAKGALAPARRYIQAFPTDNPYLPADYVDTLRNERDKVRRQRLWEGNWNYDEDNDALTTYDALSDAFSNVVLDGEKYLTVDVARKGADTTVFMFWNGLKAYKVKQFSKQGTDKTIQQIKDFAAIEKVPYSHIMIDEDGIGGGVVDHLLGVKGFTANSVPMPTGNQIKERLKKIDHFLVPKTVYSNLKAQCGWKLAELLNDRAISFALPEYRDVIIEELSATLRDKDPTTEGRKLLRAKADVKEELGRSPDVGDTMIMRMWFELQRDASGMSDTTQEAVARQQENIFLLNQNNYAMNSAK